MQRTPSAGAATGYVAWKRVAPIAGTARRMCGRRTAFYVNDDGREGSVPCMCRIAKPVSKQAIMHASHVIELMD